MMKTKKRKMIQIDKMVFDADRIIAFKYDLISPEVNAGIEATNSFTIFFDTEKNHTIEMTGYYNEIKPMVESILKAILP